MQVFNICDFVGFVFVSWCAINNKSPGNTAGEQLTGRTAQVTTTIQKRTSDKFEVDFQWNYINYTWPSVDEYKNAINSKRYIPEHNCMAGIKTHKERLYIALPRLRTGSPVTLAYVPRNSVNKNNVLLTPFPSWGMNVQNSCASLQNVQSMEIDSRGIMWLLDGNRFNKFTNCPPKIVLLDLNNRGKVIQTYVVPNEVSLQDGGFMNDIVIDQTSTSEGDYAYITDNSSQDPGLIVFSRKRNKAWKLRDRTMFADIEAANFTVDSVANVNLVPVDGIALSALPRDTSEDRVVYYCALSSLKLYAISTRILRNEPFTKTDFWRRYIKYVGEKQSQTDGMMMDNKGTLYYGLLGDDAVAKWNIYEDFTTAKEIDRKPNGLIWPDSFAFDNSGYLHVLANGINKYFSPIFPLSISSDIKFSVYKLYTGTNSYLYK